MGRIAGWGVAATATHAAATATKSAVTGKQHIIHAVSASFGTAVLTTGVTLQVKDGSTVVWEDYVYDRYVVTFPAGIAATPGNAVSAVLADGGSGAVGRVNIHGITQ